MVDVFQGSTANEAWKAAAVKLLHEKDITTLNSRAGYTQEVLHAIFSVHDPRQRWVIARRPPINPAFAIAEVVWIMNGRNDSAFLNYWNRQLPRYAGDSSHYHGAYGYRLRRHFGVDQLEKAYWALCNNPLGRQVVLQIWDCNVDFPDMNGEPANADIPCNIMALLKIRHNKLEWTQILRSNDLFRGVPYNFIQFTTIQEVMAGWLGIDVGAYTHLSDSLHLYIDDKDQLRLHAENEMVNTDSLALPKQESEQSFIELGRCINQMMKGSISEKGLQDLTFSADLSRPYQNMLIIMAGEFARRKRWHELSNDMMARCTNPMLCQVWENWQKQMQQALAVGKSLN